MTWKNDIEEEICDIRKKLKKELNALPLTIETINLLNNFRIQISEYLNKEIDYVLYSNQEETEEETEDIFYFDPILLGQILH